VLVVPLGCVLLCSVMRAIMGKLPRSRIDDSDGSLACVMWALRRLDDGLFRVRCVSPTRTWWCLALLFFWFFLGWSHPSCDFISFFVAV